MNIPDNSENNQNMPALKLLRRKLGLSQLQLSELIPDREGVGHVSRQTINQWENGKARPELTIAQIKTLCKVLKVNVMDLPDDLSQPLPPENTAPKKTKKFVSVTRPKKNSQVVLPTTGLVETYSPNSRDCEYYRYTYRDGTRVKHIHIKGGQVGSYHAENNAQEIKNAIAQGCSVGYIKEIIKNQS